MKRNRESCGIIKLMAHGMKTPIIIRLGWLLLLVAAMMTACTPEGIPYQEEEPGVFHFSAVVEGK